MPRPGGDCCSKVYLAGWFPRHSNSIRKAVPICCVYIEESGSGRIGKESVRLAVVVGQRSISKQFHAALAMEFEKED